MSTSVHLQIVGTLMLLLASAHAFFPKRLGWREELPRLSLLNRQIFVVHCIFIVLMLVLFGILSLCFTSALLQPSPLARLVLTGLVIFWSVRLAAQFLIYDARLWRGKRLHTAAHVMFSITWTYFAGVYAIALWSQWQGAEP